MTRYYILTVYHKRDAQEEFKQECYSCITKDILSAVKNKHEDAYDRGEYVALKFEYEVIQ